MGRFVQPTTSWRFSIALCGLIVVAEGYDLIVYGAVIPALLADTAWGLTSASVGLIGSQSYIGMLIGALVGGRASDVLGRRRLVLASVGWFAVWTLVCAFAAAPWQLGAARLLAGLGMGAVLPITLALVREITAPERTAMTFTIVVAGVPIGGMLAALLGLVVLPTLGWRAMFAIGGVVSLAIFALAVARLPESKSYADRADALPRARAVEMLNRPLLPATLLFPAAYFMMLLTWFGTNTWLVSIMRQLGYPLASALQYSLTLNLGAVIGSVLMAALSRRWGVPWTGTLAALLAAAGIVGFVALPTSGAFLPLVALIGLGAQSALNMIATWVADTYPAPLRATALGSTQGFGRVGAILAPSLGGAILAAGLGPRAVLAAFAIAAVMSAVLLVGLRALDRRSPAPEAASSPRLSNA